MSFAVILLLAIGFVLLSAVAGTVLLARFLTGEAQPEEKMRFDPFAAPPPSPWFLQLFRGWRGGPRRLTYRRDRHGRFRKNRR